MIKDNELKVTISSDSIKIDIGASPERVSICSYDVGYFNNPMSNENLEIESSKLQSIFKNVTGEERELDYFKSFLTTITEKLILNKIEKIKLDSDRLQSLLIYHIKTLRSVKRNFNVDHAAGITYVDTELYNLGNMNVEDLFKILDTMTKKRNEKK